MHHTPEVSPALHVNELPKKLSTRVDLDSDQWRVLGLVRDRGTHEGEELYWNAPGSWEVLNVTQSFFISRVPASAIYPDIVSIAFSSHFIVMILKIFRNPICIVSTTLRPINQNIYYTIIERFWDPAPNLIKLKKNARSH